MKAFLDFIASNHVVAIIVAAVIAIAVATLIIVSAKKKQKKRDKEYAEMFKEVPIVNDDTEEINANENLPEFTVHEMDWLKGERGFEGVLRTKLPPLKAQPETAASNAKSTENPDDGVAKQAAQPEKIEKNEPKNVATATDEVAKSAKKQKKSSKKTEKEAKKKIATDGAAGTNAETVAIASMQLSIDDLTEKKIADPDEKAISNEKVIADASESVKTENIKEEQMKKESAKRATVKAEANTPAEKVATEKTAARRTATEKVAAEKLATNKTEKVVAEKPATDKTEKAVTEKPAADKTEKGAAEKPAANKTENVVTEKPATDKTENVVTEKPATDKTDKKTLGKWIIKEKGEGEFVAYLYANNKELMLTSETYSSPDGAKKGIATIRKNAAIDDNFTYYRDKNKNYFFKLKTSKNRFLCAGETYANKSACLKSIESVKNFVDSPLAEKIEKDVTVINYTPMQDETYVPRKNSGKWIISKLDDETYFAQLFASNGELLLSSESYASYSSAKDAVENITQNGLNGNFIIDSDKKGRYFFKIRNAQKLTLCVGETYSQLTACQSAIESVFGFLKTAKLAEGK